MSDAKFFQRGKIQELRAELNSDKKDPKHQRKKMVLKKVVANMTMGNDMSTLFTDVVGCMQVDVIEIKKMVYLYLINYARVKPDLAESAIGFFLRDVNDPNPLIRALAIRTMSYIHVKVVMDNLVEPLRSCLKDSDPYVRKTAAICVPKLFMYDRNKADEEGFIAMLKDLLLDSNPTVVANAIAALTEISERSPDLTLQLNLRIASKLIAAMNECSEWGQAYILEALLFVVPQEVGDAEMLAERVAPRLQHANASVVLNAAKLIIYLMNYMAKLSDVQNMLKKLAPPLVTLLSSGPEVQYVALRNILLIIQKLPSILRDEIKVFFCKYNDPIYVKLAKLEIIFRLATSTNIGQVLGELVEYASEVDVDFVRKSVRAIGRLAIKIPSATQRCITALLELIQTKVNYVVQEGIVVIRDIFRKYPNQYESIIGKLCESLDSLDEPEAKSAMIWIIGQYADRIENSDEILENFMETFLEDPPEVQLSLLTAVVKLFIKRPTVGQELVPKILRWATEEVDNPDLRDRGYIYWRLLSVDPAAARTVVLSEHPEISTETENIEIGLLDELLLNLATLSSVYHKVPASFIANAKAKFLPDSKVLHILAAPQPEEPQLTAPAEANMGPSNPYTNDVAPVNNEKLVDLLDLDSNDFLSAMGTSELADVTYDTNLLGQGYGLTSNHYDSARPSTFTPSGAQFGPDGFSSTHRSDSPFAHITGSHNASQPGALAQFGAHAQGNLFHPSNALAASPLANRGGLNDGPKGSQPPSEFQTAASGILSPHFFGDGLVSDGPNNAALSNQVSNWGNPFYEKSNATPNQDLLTGGMDNMRLGTPDQITHAEDGSFVPSKAVLFNAQSTQGLEVLVTFYRQRGRKAMLLQLTNRSQHTVADFAVQLNRNRFDPSVWLTFSFGLAMDSGLEVPALAPHQSHTTHVLLSTGGPRALCSPLTNLQVAFKCSLGVFYSQTELPLHILFSEAGCLDQNVFLNYWRDFASVAEFQFSVQGMAPVASVEWLRNKLHTNNVFTVADRNVNGKVYMFISVVLEDQSIFLVELIHLGSGATSCSVSAKLIPNTGSLSEHASPLLHSLQAALDAVLKS
ncbi:hypothetical protein L0F63_001551 [Massospora cicadina]|nr:hypothetical protein L0F63_001551 [Massospora cicadina]